VPNCASCGLAVDWLRSCYESEWFLFAGDLATANAGRYYFSPPGTPFVPDATLLSSRVWHDRNLRIEQTAGESITAPHRYSDGATPALVPLNRVAGELDCLREGEPIALGIPPSELVSGFPIDCFVPIVPTSMQWAAASDYQSDSVQLMAARVIQWTYEGNQTQITAFLSQLLGPAWTIHYFPSTRTLPGITIAVSDMGTLVFLDGTSTFQQFALQAAYALGPPEHITNFATSLFWYDAASYVHSVIVNVGGRADRPIFLAGHSYGGVVSLILAARYRSASPTRPIRYITYGSPHVGDSALVELIRQTEGISLANTGDIVTAIPPGSPMLATLSSLLGSPGILSWATWNAAPERTLQDPAGVLTPHDEPFLDWPTLLGFGTTVVTAGVYPAIQPHQIDEYIRRIFLRAQAPKWPLQQKDYDILLSTSFIVTESGEPVTTEHGDHVVVG
jgi:pimeloyl-ACP methyl ester carboxylesterase